MTIRIALVALLAAASVAGHAQSIQKVAQPYKEGIAPPAGSENIQRVPQSFSDGAPKLPFAPAPELAREKAREWRVEGADGSLSRALRRWSRDAGYPLLWEAEKDLPAVGATYHGSFIAALEQLMRDTQNSAYPLHACAYDNLVRVIHATQACTR